MPVEQHRLFHLDRRNLGMRRLQVATRLLAASAIVLTGVFAGIAAAGNSGRKQLRSVRARRPVAGKRVYRAPPAPSLPPLSSGGNEQQAPPPPASAPAPPPQAPAPSYQQPAVVSGGS
ncbi:MAG TPA: hypothetical protein VLJ76_00480 [Gaiellaceae bacterium]|nr:hypothetical protein [Gaiellaceae bacterium]